MRGVDMTKTAAIKQSNPQNAVKRVYVDLSDMKRSAYGSGFTRCEKCEEDIAVARVESHDCEQEAKTKALVSKMKEQAVKKTDNSTNGTKRNREPKAPKAAKEAKPAKKGKGKDPNAPKKLCFGLLDLHDANPDTKGVTAAAKAGGEKWNAMSEEEKAVYNKDAEGRKGVYEHAVAKYKNKDSSKVGYASWFIMMRFLFTCLKLITKESFAWHDDGEVSEAIVDEDKEADIEDK